MIQHSQYTNKYLKYKLKYLQYGGKISLWGYIQNIISHLSSENKMIANTILPALGLSFDNIAYKNYPNKEDNNIKTIRIEFIKLLQKWKNNNLDLYITLILDMYKTELNIIKHNLEKLYNNNIYPSKEQKKILYPYIINFFNDILKYCDNEIIENILITWYKNNFKDVDINERTFYILLLLLSYLNYSKINKFNKDRFTKIIYNILKSLDNFINLI